MDATAYTETARYLAFWGYYFPLMVAFACVSIASFILVKHG